MNYLRVICLCISALLLQLRAEEPSEYTMQQIENMFPPTNKKIRIQNLWPSHFPGIPPIEPAIPKNYFLKVFPKDKMPTFFAWGQKEDLEPWDITGPPHQISHPIFLFHLSFNIKQSGPTSFSNLEDLEKSIRAQGITDFSKKVYSWGDIPVLTTKFNDHGELMYTAWIGLNYNSKAMCVQFLYPDKEDRPNEEDIQLWKTFLTKTKLLPEPYSFIVKGCDMQSGYTRINIPEGTITAIAERRKKDNLVKIALVPSRNDIEFSVTNITNGLAGSHWRENQECVQLYVDIPSIFPKGKKNLVEEPVISVFIKTVDEFSLEKERLQKNPRIICIETVLNPCTTSESSEDKKPLQN